MNVPQNRIKTHLVEDPHFKVSSIFDRNESKDGFGEKHEMSAASDWTAATPCTSQRF